MQISKTESCVFECRWMHERMAEEWKKKLMLNVVFKMEFMHLNFHKFYDMHSSIQIFEYSIYMFINRMARWLLAVGWCHWCLYWIGLLLLLLLYGYFTRILTNFQHLYRLNNNNKYLSYQVLDLHVRCTLMALRLNQRQRHSYSLYCIVNLCIAANEMI